MEHRWGQRRPVILRIRICTPGRPPAVGWLTNISVSGAHLVTSDAFAEQGLITIEVDERSRAASAREPLRVHGRVVRHGAVGVGIEWDEFATDRLAELLRIAMLPETARTNLARTVVQGLGRAALLTGPVADPLPDERFTDIKS